MGYAIIGDVHSDSVKLESALEYAQEHELKVILLGDLFDSRCDFSDSIGVYNLLKNSNAIILQSNHQDKLIRYLQGNNVVLNNGLDITVDEFKNAGISNKELLDWLISFPYGVVFRDKHGMEHRCAHAYFTSRVEVPEYRNLYKVKQNQVNRTIKNLMIYGPISHENRGERIHWWENPRHRDYILVSGHYHKVYVSSHSIVIDGGCGGPETDNCLCLYDVDRKLLKKFK
jgi:hypothetical protein